MDAVDEAPLVQRAQAGDPAAFEALVLAHQRFVYNLALRVLNNPAEAEDVSQEAFLRAWTGLPRFRAASRFGTWLYRIVINLCYNRLPRLRHDMTALPVDGEDSNLEIDHSVVGDQDDEDPARRMEANERRLFIQNQVNHLPEGYRVLILLRFTQDLSYEEIAEVVQMPLGTVKTGLFRARQQLRDRLQAYELSAELGKASIA